MCKYIETKTVYANKIKIYFKIIKKPNFNKITQINNRVWLSLDLAEVKF